MVALKPPACDFGWPAPDFHLPAIDGKTYSLADVQGSAGTIIMFICNHCPYVKTTIERIVTDCRALQDMSIGVAAIMSNDVTTYPEDDFDHMVAFAKQHDLPFPYLLDESQEVARAYDAVCTPDFYGFAADLGLQYRGRLDAGTPGNPDPGPRRELFEAMSQIAQTGQGPSTQQPAIGCSIKWR